MCVVSESLTFIVVGVLCTAAAPVTDAERKLVDRVTSHHLIDWMARPDGPQSSPWTVHKLSATARRAEGHAGGAARAGRDHPHTCRGD